MFSWARVRFCLHGEEISDQTLPRCYSQSSYKRILTTKEFGSCGHFSRFLKALGVGEARYTLRSKGQALCTDEEALSIQRAPREQQHPL